MRLPDSAHASRPWRIHEIAPDFTLEDVWALPARGGPGDFRRLVEVIGAYDPGRSSHRAVRALFAVRWRAGELLGLDREATRPGSRVPTLRDRLPEDLREGDGAGRARAPKPFRTLYATADEWAFELANRTVHGVLHLGWVPDGDGHRGQMAVLVKPNGLLGEAYLAAIKPVRHRVVYPLMLEELGREWRTRSAAVDGVHRAA